MTQLSITKTDVAPIEILSQFTLPSGETNIYAGQWVYENTDGELSLGAYDGYVDSRVGVAIVDGALNEAVTVVEDGLVSVGTALDTLDPTAKVYVSGVAGSLQTSAGTTSVVAGHVEAKWGATTIDKVLRVKRGG
jgi:hypothetical protein